jgi:hypothetical protein
MTNEFAISTNQEVKVKDENNIKKSHVFSQKKNHLKIN